MKKVLIEQINCEDNVIINLLPDDAFQTVRVEGELFCIHRRYEDLKFVGRGSQGVVCSANDKVLGQMIAIKKITNPFTDLEDAKRAYRELKVLKLVDYKYIIKLLGAFITSTSHRPSSLPYDASNVMPNSPEDNQRSSNDVLFTNSYESKQNDLYLVLEYIESNLSQVVRLRLDHEKISYLTYQMFCALNYLQDASIIHRDLKPSNIAVKDCSIKILDFGLARTENQFMTPYVQTRYYRAPELILDMESYSNLVDVWSIGCIMGELITGDVLFRGTNSLDQWQKIVEKLGMPDQSFINKLSPKSHARKYIQKQKSKSSEDFMDSIFTTSDNPGSKQDELARNLLTRMLVINPAKRITVQQALQHDYLKIWFDEDDFKHPHISKLNQLVDKDCKSIEDWKKLIHNETTHYSTFYC